MMKRIRLVLPVVAIGVVGLTGEAYAQQAGSGLVEARPVWENAKGGAVVERAPGRMVQRGKARFEEAHGATIAKGLHRLTIDEGLPASSLVQQTLADMLEIVFRDLNVLLAALLAQQALDGGLPPSGTPPDVSPPGTDVGDLLGTISGPETT